MHPEKLSIEETFTAENLIAEDAISQGDLPQAAQILVQIVEKDPRNWRAYNNMGVLSWIRQHWNDAYVMFKKSASINPTYIDALLNLFDASLKLKKVTEVLPIFELALQTDPDLNEIKILHQNIIDQGENIYFSPKALSIGVFSPLLDEAEKELEAGNLIKSMDLFLKANDTEGPSARTFGGLGIISFYQKNFDDAFSLFIESIKLNPLDREMFQNLLDAAKECNKLAAAREIFDLYRKQFPSLEEIASDFDNISTN